MRVAVVAASVLAVHVLRDVEALDLARDVDVVFGRVEEGDVGDPGLSGNERVPGDVGADTDR